MLETGRRIIIDASYPSGQSEWYGNGEIDLDGNLILPAGTTQQAHDAIREQMQAGQVSGQSTWRANRARLNLSGGWRIPKSDTPPARPHRRPPFHPACPCRGTGHT